MLLDYKEQIYTALNTAFMNEQIGAYMARGSLHRWHLYKACVWWL